MDKRVYFSFVIFLVSWLIVSCDSMTSVTQGPEERAIARWEALIAGDWKSAYEYETPGYRQTKTVDDLRMSYGGLIDWKAIQVLRVNHESENAAVVELELKSVIYDPGFGGEGMLIPTQFKEHWLRKDGQWWYVRD